LVSREEKNARKEDAARSAGAGDGRGAAAGVGADRDVWLAFSAWSIPARLHLLTSWAKTYPTWTHKICICHILLKRTL
jgi:hypothetical protein